MRGRGDILPPDPNPGGQRDVMGAGILLQVGNEVSQSGHHVSAVWAMVRVQRSGLTTEAPMGEYGPYHPGHAPDLLSTFDG